MAPIQVVDARRVSGNVSRSSRWFLGRKRKECVSGRKVRKGREIKRRCEMKRRDDKKDKKKNENKTEMTRNEGKRDRKGLADKVLLKDCLQTFSKLAFTDNFYDCHKTK